MIEDRLEGIDYFLGTQRLLHPQRGTDYLPRSDMIWLVEQAREAERLPGAQVTIGKLSHEIAQLRQGDEFSRMHAEMVGLHRGFEVKEAEIARLRELLGRLEWAAGDYEHGNAPCCPECLWWKEHGHNPAGCELAKELHIHDQPTRPE